MSAGTQAKKLRLFVAFEIPETHLDALGAALDPVRDSLGGGRWTSKEQQHVTLKFVGWMDPARLDDVKQICSTVAGELRRAEVSLADPGTFPNMRRARVLWVGIDDPAGLTPRLAADLNEALAPLGVEPEERVYRPHLTLARFKPPRDLRSLEGVDVPILDAFPIAAITLFRSHLARTGSRYEVLERFALR